MMNIKLFCSSLVTVGFALGAVPTYAQNGFPPNPAAPGLDSIVAAERASSGPSFNPAEQVGLCLVESVVSLLASYTQDFGCNGSYDLAVTTLDNQGGEAVAVLSSSGGSTTLVGTLGPQRSIGRACFVREAPGSRLAGGVAVANYNGGHGWSRGNTIFNSDARITLVDPQTGTPDLYREVNIKDYFKRVIGGRAWEFDWGLEEIKKRNTAPFTFYYPVQKWTELSWYSHSNGQDGALRIRKHKIKPSSAFSCRINADFFDVFNGSGEFEALGTVRVFQSSNGG
ncbi:MAG: hypothetical protein ACREYF_02845 [Gammaproteobacteria bacterium]